MKGPRLTEMVAGVSTSAFALTVIYVLGYSLTLRVNLFLYFGLNDYFRLAAEWLPPVLAGLLVGVLLNEYFKRVEKGLTEGEIIATSKHPQRTRRFREAADRALPILIVLVAVSDTILYFVGDMPRQRLLATWGVATPILWLALVNWYLRVPRLAARVAQIQIGYPVIITVVPMFIIGSFFYGLYSGAAGSRLYVRPVDAELVVADDSAAVCGRILFALKDHLLVQEASDSTIIIFPMSAIQRITHRKCSGA